MSVQHVLPNRSRPPRRPRWLRMSVLAGLAALLALVPLLAVPMAGASPAAQVELIFRLGYLGPVGTDTANGAQLAIDQINSIGGITAPDGSTFQLELVPLTFTPTAESLPEALATLTDEGVDVILGPDNNALITAGNLEQIIEAGVPVLSGATVDQLTDADTSDVIFRTRAPERVYNASLATYLIEDLALAEIALVQTDVDSTEALLSFEAVLTTLGQQPVDRVQIPDGSELDDVAQRLLGVGPEVVVLWGPPKDAASLLQKLRDNGWDGRFAYRYADEAARAGVLPDELADGVLGVTSWSYAGTDRATQIFLREYVLGFGRVPGPLAAAAYDAVWFLRGIVRSQGADQAALLSGLIGGTPQTLVQGTLHPIEFANGDLARLAAVYVLGARGGPTVVARFDDNSRLTLGGAPPDDETGDEGGEDGATPVPDGGDEGATPVPDGDAPTPVPTATLEGTWVEVTANVLNVRSGPGFNYERVNQVNAGEQYRVLGAIPDLTWVSIDINGQIGWVKTEFVRIIGDLSGVPILQPPATPTPAPTATPTVAPVPDIVIDTVVLSPTQPVPGQPFSATVTVRNAGGGAAGAFSIAATFQPGDVFTSAFIPGLAAGQSIQVQLSGTLPGTGVFTEVVVADLNKEVAEANEDNNNYSVTYRVDYPTFVQQSNIQLVPGTQWDLYGGTNDLEWDGSSLAMRNGALIGLIGGTYESAHYDQLAPGLITNGTGLTSGEVLVGSVYGMYTAEGQRAVLRIDNRQGDTLWISYRVYNSNP